jgi:hypothetical protein
MDQIRIAYVAACPRGFPRLRVENEYRHIEAELDRSRERDRFDCRYEPAVTRTELLRKLLKLRPHVLHFGGHGTDRDELMFETDDGEAEAVSTEVLAWIFSAVPVADRPQIVVLSSCYSTRQADALVRYVDCAVGISREISDTAACDFAQGFYLGLAQGLPVHAALDAGRGTMPAASADMPQLHKRDSADLARPLLVAAGPVSRYPTDLHIDRTEELAQFDAMLTTGDPRLLLITANGLMGKSELMAVMARRAAGHPCASLDLTREVTDADAALVRMGQQLRLPAMPAPAAPVDRMAGDLAGADPQWSAHRQADLVQQTRQLLQAGEAAAAEQDRRLVLLLDGFDTSQGEIAAWVEDVLLLEVLFAERTVCVVAGRVKPRVRTGLHLVREEVLGNFRRQDVKAALRLLRLNESETAVDFTWVLAQQGNPFQTAVQLELLWKNAVGLGT